MYSPYRYTSSAARNGLTNIYQVRGSTLSGLNSSLRWRKSCSFSSRFLLQFLGSDLVIDFATSEFSERACARFAEVICLSFSQWAELSLLSNISLAAAAPRFGVNTSPFFNCFLVYRFASCGFCLRRD